MSKRVICNKQAQDEFIACGLASRDEAKRTGAYVGSSDVVMGLASRLTKAKAKKIEDDKTNYFPNSF